MHRICIEYASRAIAGNCNFETLSLPPLSLLSFTLPTDISRVMIFVCHGETWQGWSFSFIAMYDRTWRWYVIVCRRSPPASSYFTSHYSQTFRFLYAAIPIPMQSTGKWENRKRACKSERVIIPWQRRRKKKEKSERIVVKIAITTAKSIIMVAISKRSTSLLGFLWTVA